MMRQCWFIGKIDHYGDCDNGGGYARMAAETIWGFSVFPLPLKFVVNLKLLQIKSLKNVLTIFVHILYMYKYVYVYIYIYM